MPSLSRKHRYPKPGTGFLLIRLIGWCLQIVGWLLIAAALVGFITVLVKTGSTLIGAFQFIEQKMAGLVIIGILVWLAVFVLLGLVGVILVGIGFAFGRWGTEPATPASLQSSTAPTPT
jgi:hypothetical protein